MLKNVELASFRFKTDRGKTFFFDLKENKNGRFLRITESRFKPGDEEGYIRNFMTVPERYLNEFVEKLVSAENYFKSHENNRQEEK